MLAGDMKDCLEIMGISWKWAYVDDIRAVIE
jgi:hypothetical protein